MTLCIVLPSGSHYSRIANRQPSAFHPQARQARDEIVGLRAVMT